MTKDKYQNRFIWDESAEEWSSKQKHPVTGKERLRNAFRDEDETGVESVFFIINRKIRAELNRLLDQLAPNEKLLELTAGSGGFGMYARNLFNKVKQQLVVSDYSLGMLKGHDLDVKNRVQCQLEDHLPFKTGGFSRVISIFGMRYTDNHENVIEEVIRVLKPDGQAIIIDYLTLGHKLEKRHFDPRKILRNLGAEELEVIQDDLGNFFAKFSWGDVIFELKILVSQELNEDNGFDKEPLWVLRIFN